MSGLSHKVGGWVMVFNATFNNNSAISWWSVLLVEETGVMEKTLKCGIKHYNITLLSKESLKSDGQQFLQYQQNEQPPLTFTH